MSVEGLTLLLVAFGFACTALNGTLDRVRDIRRRRPRPRPPTPPLIHGPGSVRRRLRLVR